MEGTTVHVVAGKKNVSKRAVDRNRAKRRVKAALRVCFGSGLESLAKSAHSQTTWILSCNRALLTAEWDALLKEVQAHGREVFGLAE